MFLTMHVAMAHAFEFAKMSSHKGLSVIQPDCPIIE